MKFTTRFILDLFIFILILIGGCIGFIVIEGWDLLEALYMTVITLTTVGFQEVHPLSRAGKIFTMFLIVSGVGFILYFLSSTTGMMIAGTLRDVFGRRKLEKQISHIEGHYIVCGFGRIGRTVSQLLKEKPVEVVIIERNPIVSPFFKKKIFYMSQGSYLGRNSSQGGYSQCQRAGGGGLLRCGQCLYYLDRPGIKSRIIYPGPGREESSVVKLTRAGADKVVSPYDIGARSMANSILRPTVIDFIELAMHNRSLDLQIEELTVGEKSEIKDLTLMESAIRKDFDLIVVAIKKGTGEMIFNPSSQAKIQVGDILVVLETVKI